MLIIWLRLLIPNISSKYHWKNKSRKVWASFSTYKAPYWYNATLHRRPLNAEMSSYDYLVIMPSDSQHERLELVLWLVLVWRWLSLYLCVIIEQGLHDE